MVRGRGGHRRQRVEPRQDVVVARVQRRDLERGRDEDRAVQADPGRLLKHPRQPAHPVAPVALARDEDGRAPPPVAREPAAHELAQRLEVALLPEVLLGIAGVLLLPVLRRPVALALDDAAETRAYRVDEDKVGEGEPRRLVLHEPGRHRRQRPIRGEGNALRAHDTQVQVRGRGSGAAVEDEHHGTTRIAHVGDVGDGEDLRRGLLLLAQHEPLRACRVVDRGRSAGPGAARLRSSRRLVIRLGGGGLVLLALVGHGETLAHAEMFNQELVS